jgi:hypothetical protein
MANRYVKRDIKVCLIGVVVLAIASSRLFVAPDSRRLGPMISLIVGLSFGPFLEHLCATTSPARWALDSVLAGALILMIGLRFFKETWGRIVLSYIGVVLWYSLAFLTLMNHSE